MSTLTDCDSARMWTVTTMGPAWTWWKTSGAAVPWGLRGNSVRSTGMTVKVIPVREPSPTATISSTTTSASVRQDWKGSPVSSILTSVRSDLVNMEHARMVSETTPVTASRDTPVETAPRSDTVTLRLPFS